MVRDGFRRLRAALAATGLAVAATVTLGTVAAPPAAADSFWTCSIPAGYTYDEVRSGAGACGGSSSVQFHAVLPFDGLQACTRPAGFVFTHAAQVLARCTTSGFANLYTLRIPADGLDACQTAVGFVYDHVTSTLADCFPSGFADKFRLRVPVTGLWACSVPTGFTYTEYRSVLATCSSSGFSNLYLLQKR